MPAPRHDRAVLEDRMRSTMAAIAAIDAQAFVLAKKRAAHNAEFCRMACSLARIPTDGDDTAPVLRGPEAIPIKEACRIADCDDGTLHRHGKAAGWVFQRGRRWYVRTADLYAWMTGKPARS